MSVSIRIPCSGSLLSLLLLFNRNCSLKLSLRFFLANAKVRVQGELKRFNKNAISTQQAEYGRVFETEQQVIVGKFSSPS